MNITQLNSVGTSIRRVNEGRISQLIEQHVGRREYFDQPLASKEGDGESLKEEESSRSHKYIEQFQIPEINLQLPVRQHISVNKFRKGDSLSINLKFMFCQKGMTYGLKDIWRSSSLRIIYLVAKFLNVLKVQTSRYKFKFVNKKILNVLGDSTCDFDFYKINGLIGKKPSQIQRIGLSVTLFIRRHLKNNRLATINLGVIQPDSNFKIIFDFILLLLIVTNIFYIPMKLSFQLEKHLQNIAADILLDTLPSVVFILEIGLNFNTSFYEEGVVHESRKKIFYNYIYGDFFWDLLVVIPFIISRSNIPYMDFILLLRVTRIPKIVNNLEESTNIRERFSMVIDLVKLVYFLVFCSHICACIWNFIGDQQMQNSDDPTVWIRRYHMEEVEWYSRYVYCFYWSTITTLTIGYGDIVPGNDIERLFVIVMILITSIVFGYTISSIGQIFHQIKEKNDRFKNQMAIMNSYLKSSNLNKQLQMKVRKYFEYYFKNEQDQTEECQRLMRGQLSPALKNEVMIDFYKKILQRNSLFKEHFSNAFVNQICQVVRTQKFTPQESIFKQNEVCSKLMFIMKGEMEIYVQREKRLIPLRHFKKGNVVGTKNFFTQRQNEYSAKATKFIEIVYIQYQDFIDTLEHHPSDLQTFYNLRDKLHFNPTFKDLKDICAVCLSNHELLKCPFIFFQANKAKLFGNNLKTNPRQNFKRRDFILREFLQCRQEYQEEAINVCFDRGLLKQNEMTAELYSQLGFKDKNNMKETNYSKQSKKLIRSKESKESRKSRQSIDSEKSKDSGEVSSSGNNVSEYSLFVPPENEKLQVKEFIQLIQQDPEPLDSISFSKSSSSININNAELLSVNKTTAPQVQFCVGAHDGEKLKRTERRNQKNIIYNLEEPRKKQIPNKKISIVYVQEKKGRNSDINLKKTMTNLNIDLNFSEQLDVKCYQMLDIIRDEYIRFIQEDKLPELDKFCHYDKYSPTDNLDTFIGKITLQREIENNRKIFKRHRDIKKSDMKDYLAGSNRNVQFSRNYISRLKPQELII